MPLPPAFCDALPVPIELDAPLARRVWWRVGGPADGLVSIDDVGTLSRVRAVAHAHGVPTFVLGNGSNLLVSDRGVEGLVIHLGGLDASEARGDLLHVGAGLKNVVLLARAAKHRWAGLDPLAGIPGTLGGAVRMNAGSALGEIGDFLHEVDLVLPDGSPLTLPAAALNLGYRTCHLPDGAIVTAARLRLGDGPYEASEARIRTFLERRKATQPLDLPSCGSTFRNPPGDAAGRLVEAAGLKGFTLGGAQVSPKHANFVVNLGGATAGDIAGVIDHVQATVLERFGVHLEPEVERVGRW